MKFRAGFVSNSSSSSFVCDICNHTEEIHDGNFEYSELIVCQNGHVYCADHDGSTSAEEIREQYQSLGKWDELCLPEALCPICQLRELPASDLALLLLDSAGYKTRKAAVKDMLACFRTRDEIVAHIKKLYKEGATLK